MDRRAFLHTSGAALGGLALLGATGDPPTPPVPRRLGVQLYTVRDLFPHDVVGTLEALRRIGYDEVEFAGLHGHDPRAVRQVLDGLGLTAPAAHVALDALRRDFGAEIETAHALGYRFLVVPGVDESERASLDGYRRLAAEFNTLGTRLREAGLQLAYHNHDAEFETFGGDTPAYDVLLAETDPALVAMELDLFWTVHAGHDPVDYFARYPDHFPLVHVKDRTAGGAMVDVGAGTIDWARIFDHAESAGLQHAIVEHDEPDGALRSVRASHDYLARLRGS